MGGGLHAEPRAAADGLQRPLRSRFRQRLSLRVEMTSGVKRLGKRLSQVCCMLFPVGDLVDRKRRSPSATTGDPADLRGWGPTGRVSVGCRPRSRHEETSWSLNAPEGYTTPGRGL
jgi:hypothetical protein